jgi:hypothetical protein
MYKREKEYFSSVVAKKVLPAGRTPKQKKKKSVMSDQGVGQTSTSDNPTLPIPPQQPQNLPLPHRILTRQLQHPALITIRQLRAGREFQTNAVRQLLALEIGCVGRFEVGEVEFLSWARGVVLGLLGGWWGEVQVAGVVEGEPAAFPELRFVG